MYYIVYICLPNEETKYGIFKQLQIMGITGLCSFLYMYILTELSSNVDLVSICICFFICL